MKGNNLSSVGMDLYQNWAATDPAINNKTLKASAFRLVPGEVFFPAVRTFEIQIFFNQIGYEQPII